MIADFGLPLGDVRVLDCTRLLPGSFGTQLLADLGAEVIKIEQPGGEMGRQHDRFPTVNRHKLSVILDLGAPEDKQRFEELLATADVLIENFRPGVMERFGLGFVDLHQRFPALVYVSSTGYAKDGPSPRRPGHDLNYLAVAGALQPRLHDRPVLTSMPVGDLATGMTVALSTLAALHYVRSTGQGQLVSTSMADISLVLAAVGAGRLPPVGDQHPVELRTWPDVPLGNFPCYGTYPTADGRFVSFGNIEPKFWEDFLSVTGLIHLSDAQFATGTTAEAAKAAIAEVVAARTMAEWEEAFEGREVCFAPVRTLREAVSAPDVVARDLVSIDSTDLMTAAFPATFSRTPPRRGGKVPRAGEHDHQILGESNT
jgi:crotonobetainyl-CoA:carnitine CoA-transferase CaiB-like acyl-CoA transferase